MLDPTFTGPNELATGVNRPNDDDAVTRTRYPTLQKSDPVFVGGALVAGLMQLTDHATGDW